MIDLSKVPFLAGLDAADIDALQRRMEERTHEAGDLVYAEGAPGDGLYYVESGTVAVLTSASCEGEIMAHLPKGSTFGESALISDRPRSTAARAASDCVLLTLSRVAYLSFLAERPAAGLAVQQTLTQRPRRSARQLVAELLKPMPLFTGVADDALLAIARKLKLTPFCAESLIFAEGYTNDALYLVESGTVRLQVGAANGQALVDDIGPLNFFGEDGLLSDEPSEISAFAATAADLWSLNRSDFDELVNAYPAAVLRLTRTLASRAEHVNRQLLALTAHGAVPSVTMVATAVAAPKKVVVPVSSVPAQPRQSLVGGFRLWLGELSPARKAVLAGVAILLAWALLVSLPAVVAGSIAGSSAGPAVDTRSVAMAASSRGAALIEALEGNDIEDAEDEAEDAPLLHLAELVVVRKDTPTPAAVPTTAPVQAAPTATPVPTAKYTVSAGDTLGQIAAKFNLDVDVLAAANGIQNVGMIGLGQELLVPGGDEVIALAAQIAAAPKPTPVPPPPAAPAAVAVAAAPAAAPAAPKENPGLPFVWDGRMDKFNIKVENAGVAPGQPYYRLVKALFRDTNEVVGPNMPNGDHNIYVEVLDEGGKRVVGAKVSIRNGGTTMLTTENKPFPEYATNFPMYGMMGSYSANVEGLPSDKMVGMGLPMHWHVSYFLTFQKTTK